MNINVTMDQANVHFDEKVDYTSPKLHARFYEPKIAWEGKG